MLPENSKVFEWWQVIAAAEVIASLVESPTSETIIPSVFDERLVPEIAKVIQ